MNREIWQYLTEQPQTREHLEAKYPASILRNMRRSKHLVEVDGLCHAGKQPLKKWASNAERNAFYSMQWQRRMQEDKGPKGEAFRAKRAKKPRTVKAKPVVAPKPKPVKPRPISIEPRRLSVTESTPESVRLPCSSTFIQQNPDRFQVLPAGVWAHPVLRFEY